MRSSLHLMMCIIVPNIALSLVAAAFLCLDYSWSNNAATDDADARASPDIPSNKEWNAAFYKKSLTAFACLLAAISGVKSVMFALFSCRSRCRTCGMVYWQIRKSVHSISVCVSHFVVTRTRLEIYWFHFFVTTWCFSICFFLREMKEVVLFVLFTMPGRLGAWHGLASGYISAASLRKPFRLHDFFFRLASYVSMWYFLFSLKKIRLWTFCRI